MTNSDAIFILSHVEAHGLADEARKLAIDALKAEPVKHGHWISDEETGDLRCSVCGHYTDEIEGHWGEVDEELAEVLGVPVGTRYHASGLPSYCSRCGSRMYEVEE